MGDIRITGGVVDSVGESDNIDHYGGETNLRKSSLYTLN